MTTRHGGVTIAPKTNEACAGGDRDTARAGGTITGEHGVGLDKREYMRLIFSDGELAAQNRLKRAFDPDGRCNPDKMLPTPAGGGPTGATAE